MPRVPIHHLIEPNPAPSIPVHYSHAPIQSSIPPQQYLTSRNDLPRTTHQPPSNYHSPIHYGSPQAFPTPPTNFEENGRIYYGYRNNMYPYPVDEAEGGRLDQLHYMIYDTLLDGRLHVANLRHAENNPHFRILDVGFGTSLWAQFISADYPKAQVIGIDLKGYIGDHTKATFPNLDLRNGVDFTDEDWGFEENSFDFIHLSLLAGSVPNWQSLYRKCLKYLKPGVGQLEHVELDLKPRSQTATIPPYADHLRYYWECLSSASARAGLPMEYCPDTGILLENLGFANPSDTRFRVPLSDRGVVDEHERCVGRWFQSAMQDEFGIRSYQGLAMALFTRHLGWKKAEVDDICEKVLDVLKRDRGELFHTLHVWTARKPSR
ncbi:Hypothetical protein R9X50_00342000 [Acrodontium crateriforme]|uniref:S-adenosyl-L-methionine-dependent methyltransferase n=1 Tax=Acrodontium crateriforme TaxID=150365 RepID=A0AAQ3M499_9PEZI|nr:Hypothetical protein R9X50_00342000 [Acrodontium crateriforme]